jgi:predicted nucleic acid-binding protein
LLKTLLISSVFYFLIVKSGHMGGGLGAYVAGLMWSPGFAALLTCKLAQPAVVLLQPSPRHWELLWPLVLQHNATGPLVTNAVLAALAIENGALLASTDHGFSRFRELRWINPLHK